MANWQAQIPTMAATVGLFAAVGVMGPAPAMALGWLVAPTIANVAGNLASTLTQRTLEYDRLGHLFSREEGLRHPALQKASAEAIRQAIGKLKRQWQTSLRHAIGRDPLAAEEIERTLDALLREFDAFFNDGGLSQDNAFAGATRALNEADAHNLEQFETLLTRQLGAFLTDDYRHLAGWLSRTLLREVTRCLIDYLATDKPENNIAWRNFQLLMLRDIVQGIGTVGQGIAGIAAAQQELHGQLAALQSQPQDQRDPYGEAALTAWRGMLSQELAEMAARLLAGIKDIVTEAVSASTTTMLEAIRNATTLPPPTAGDIATAEALLATMPLNAVPAPGDLPLGSIIALTTNPLFVGREGDLKELAASLQAGRTVAVAAGIPGVGKTQLAIEFAHRYGRYFAGGVFWLTCDPPDAMAAAVAACGTPGAGNVRALPLPPGFDDPNQPVAERAAAVKRAWETPLPRLLIFDNCEDETILRDWRPAAGGCRILVTSRRDRWDRRLGVQVQEVEELSRPESVALLRRHRPDLTAGDPDLDAIAAELGDLPLALQLAGSFLATYEHDTPPADYLDELRQADPVEHESLTTQELSVARAFDRSLVRLDPTAPTDALARTLLARAACFAQGEPIPRDLLLATLELPDTPADRRRAAAALNRLGALGLVESEHDDAARLHRLIAHFVQTAVPDEDTAAAIERVLSAHLGPLIDAGLPAAFVPLREHLRVVSERALAREGMAAASFCAGAGRAYSLEGDYLRARLLQTHVLALREAALPPGHPDLATSLNNLAAVLQAQGDYAAARTLHERALAIWEAALPPGHPDLAQSLNNLAETLRAQGDYAAARPLHERALAIREAALPPGHPHLATSLNNLAAVLQAQGDYAAARTLHERALAIWEAALPPGHPDLATSLNNLAATLRAQGDLAAARPLHERALAILEAALPPGHPDLATSLNNLAATLRAQGDLAAARPLHERALAIREAALPPGHPHLATSLNNLALVLQAQGDYAAARPLHERALAIWEAALPPGHPDLAQSLNNLALVLQAQGDLAAARPLHERALAIREAALPPGHPHLATSLNNLALVLQAQGDLAAARPLHERALAICEAALPPGHPDLATSLNNLGATLRAQGDYAAARPLHERALAIREAALPPGHPDLAQSLNNLALVLQAQGDLAAARPLHERALAIREAALPPGHPHLATSLNNLAAVLWDLSDLPATRQVEARILALREASLPPEHPEIGVALGNLAQTIQAQGDLAGACTLFERALTNAIGNFGPEHPHAQFYQERLVGLAAELNARDDNS